LIEYHWVCKRLCLSSIVCVVFSQTTVPTDNIFPRTNSVSRVDNTEVYNMQARILDNIIDMTSQRDVDMLNRSFVNILIDLTSVSSVSLLNFARNGKYHIAEELERVEARSGEGNCLIWSDRKKPVKTDSAIQQCAKTVKPVNMSIEGGRYRLIYPIFREGSVLGIISLVSERNLSKYHVIIERLTNIYNNFMVVMDKSERDKLTGLLNRRSFDHKLKRLLQLQEINQKKEVEDDCEGNLRQLHDNSSAWLVILDIDHFKRVNDQFGHMYGDEVILTLSQQMKKCFRSSDLLFRFGGEEFIVVLAPIPMETAANVLNRFRNTMETYSFPMVGTVTVSIGYAKITEQDYPPIILERADKALYYAKENGRNSVYNFETLVKEGSIVADVETGEIDIF